MFFVNNPGSGIFYPHEISQMVARLRRGDRPGETPGERLERARYILGERDLLRGVDRMRPDIMRPDFAGRDAEPSGRSRN